MGTIFIVLGILGGGAFLLSQVGSRVDSLPILGGGFDQNIILVGSKSSTDVITVVNVSTSTPTSTKTVIIGNEIDQVDLQICVTASSTTSIVKWQLEYSDDETNFFGEDSNTVSGVVVTHGASTTTHQWTPATTEPICKTAVIANTNSKVHKFTFFRGANSSIDSNNFDLYAEAIFKAND